FEIEAILFATSYRKLVYFGHALEMLLHQVLEDEAEFSARCCARKTEVPLWDYLFPIVDKCMSTRLLKTATSYLLVLHTLEPSSDNSKVIVVIFWPKRHPGKVPP
ncbi:9249_t:CDS:2, partial [Diversispora eburnea]